MSFGNSVNNETTLDKVRLTVCYFQLVAFVIVGMFAVALGIIREQQET